MSDYFGSLHMYDDFLWDRRWIKNEDGTCICPYCYKENKSTLAMQCKWCNHIVKRERQ